MKLKSLTLNFFMSFGPENTIDLEDRGLTLINGINEASDTASSNGAGKTNLQEALLWVLFGKTTKEVAANDVVNNLHKKDCFVKAVFSTESHYYHIHRYRKHSEFGDDLHFFRTAAEGAEKENLAGVDKAETQKRIEQFLGCGFTLFCNSAYFSQGNVKPFSTYTDKQIKEVFIDALDMGRFTAGLEKARLDLKTLREELATLEGRKTRLAEETQEAKTRKTDYQTKHDAFDTTQKAELAAFDSRTAETQEQINRLEAKFSTIGTLTKAIENHETTLAKLPENLATKSSLAETATRFGNSFFILKRDAEALQRRLTEQKTELTSASSRVGTTCTECGKPITEADLADVIAGVEAQIKTTEADLAKFRALIERAAPKLEEYQAQEAALNDQIEECNRVERSIGELKVAISRAEASKKEKAILEGQIKTLKLEKIKKAEQTSPWADLINKEQAAIEEADAKIATLEGIVAEKRDEIRYAEFWEMAFGYSGIPSFLLDTVTPFLNERANHHSTTVTGGEIEIDFATVTKTKKGELKDKFAINISHKTGAKAYKGSSGGERKRADICIAQSIQDLVRSFGRNTLGYCSYDEPFEDLDEEGISYVVEMLHEISREIGTVLVVTHNNELKAMFENIITVIKGKDGYSRIMA